MSLQSHRGLAFENLEQESALDLNAKYQANSMRQVLKIAIFTEAWLNTNERPVAMMHFAKGLQHRGHKILWIRPQQEQFTYHFLPDAECILKNQNSHASYTQSNWSEASKIAHALDQFKPDIIHIATEGTLGLATLQLAKQRRIPVSSGFHSAFDNAGRHTDLAFLMPSVRRYLKWFHNATDLTCVPHQTVLQTLSHLGISCPLEVIEQGVDEECFHPQLRSESLRQIWGADQHTTILLSIAVQKSDRDAFHLQVQQILSVLQALKQQQRGRKIIWVVLMDTPHCIDDLHIYPEIQFVEKNASIDMAQYYASADVLLSNDQIKNCSTMLLEAMASGLAVFTYDNIQTPHQTQTVLKTLLRHNENAWLVPAGQTQSWQQQLLHLPDLSVIKKMGKRALSHISGKGWEQAIIDFEHVLIRYAKKSALII